MADPRQQPGIALGQLAVDAGHADQAHLIRDFRRFTGRARAVRAAAGLVTPVITTSSRPGRAAADPRSRAAGPALSCCLRAGYDVSWWRTASSGACETQRFRELLKCLDEVTADNSTLLMCSLVETEPVGGLWLQGADVVGHGKTTAPASGRLGQ